MVATETRSSELMEMPVENFQHLPHSVTARHASRVQDIDHRRCEPHFCHLVSSERLKALSGRRTLEFSEAHAGDRWSGSAGPLDNESVTRSPDALCSSG